MAHTESYAARKGRPLSGVVGFFPNPHSLVEGMSKVRDAKYESFDAFTPFPVHGLDAAQGLKRSFLPYVTFIAGLTGFAVALWLQYWTSAVDWPLIVGGKPLFSWPAFVPVLFELTVLFAALSTVGAMFLANGLPELKRKCFDPAITRDRFVIWIGAGGQRSGFKSFSEFEVKDFLIKAGAVEVRAVYEEGWF